MTRRGSSNVVPRALVLLGLAGGATAPVQDSVAIPDPVLEGAVRAALAIPAGPISRAARGIGFWATGEDGRGGR